MLDALHILAAVVMFFVALYWLGKKSLGGVLISLALLVANLLN